VDLLESAGALCMHVWRLILAFSEPLVEPATWTLRVYGALAVSHMILQYWFALAHQRRLSKEKVVAARHRGVSVQDLTGNRQVTDRSLASTKRLRVREAKVVEQALDQDPMPEGISLWVTVYQENLKLLRNCLRSLQRQDFQGVLEIIVSDDGSYLAQIGKYSQIVSFETFRRQWRWSFLGEARTRKAHAKRLMHDATRLHKYRKLREELLAVFDEFRSDSRFEFILSKRNEGKRDAQQKAWRMSRQANRILRKLKKVVRKSKRHWLYGSVDSDTVLDPNAISQLASNFKNPDVAAATGYVDVRNYGVNLLTRLIDQRYWHAFHVERAAQSYHKAVMCCSGPLAAYRADVIDQVMGRYATQRFLNKFCTFGDDRHLTNLVLTLGYLVVMDPRAHCVTEVPEKLRQYIKQQTRWNKSFYREMLWTTGAIRSHSWYMTYDLTMQFLLPFLLVAAILSTAIIAVTGGGLATVLLYVATIFGIGFVRSLYGAIMRRRVSYLLFVLYGPIYICVLMPVRWYALVTLLLGKTQWGTREA
jgi:hyaluronan synthase